MFLSADADFAAAEPAPAPASPSKAVAPIPIASACPRPGIARRAARESAGPRTEIFRNARGLSFRSCQENYRFLRHVPLQQLSQSLLGFIARIEHAYCSFHLGFSLCQFINGCLRGQLGEISKMRGLSWCPPTDERERSLARWSGENLLLYV